MLETLERTKEHPTADQVLLAVQKTFPTVSRATVYNTLDALTKAGMVLRITVDPAVARYDADLSPHAHFRCRICSTVYDVVMDREFDLDEHIEGHHVEAVRTYAYGICANCLQSAPGSTPSITAPQTESRNNTTQRNPQDCPSKPTKTAGEKTLKTTSPSESPSVNTRRKAQSFSNDPTEGFSEKASKTTSPSNSPSNEGGELPDARAS